VDVDDRHFGHPEHRVTVEVTLPHAAIVDSDFPIQGGRQAEHNTALHLRHHGIGIHQHTTIHGTAAAISSRKLSVIKAFCELPTERHGDIGTPVPFQTRSTWRFGMA
jgi:hypothetical protein